MITEQRPGREFNSLIEKIWVAPRAADRGLWTYEILPDGNFDLLFMMDDAGCRLLYTGPFTEPRRVQLSRAFEYVCVRFRPGIMPRVADVCASDIVNSWADLPAILRIGTDELGERLFRAKDTEAKVQVLEQFFRTADINASLPKESFLKLARMVDRSRGTMRVEDLAAQAGTSRRSLERTFLAQTGLQPKTFIRMVRFQHVLARLRRPQSYRNLADLACDHGYTDQSHFIRDFKKLSQRLPGRIGYRA